MIINRENCQNCGHKNYVDLKWFKDRSKEFDDEISYHMSCELCCRQAWDVRDYIDDLNLEKQKTFCG